MYFEFDVKKKKKKKKKKRIVKPAVLKWWLFSTFSFTRCIYFCLHFSLFLFLNCYCSYSLFLEVSREECGLITCCISMSQRKHVLLIVSCGMWWVGPLCETGTYKWKQKVMNSNCDCVQFMQKMGNSAARAIYEKYVPAFFYRPQQKDCKWVTANTFMVKM